MLKLKNITMKNFMSIGAVTQTVNLDKNALTLILGDNIDLGSEGSRNGVGKSVMVDALSFALYGTPVRKISVGNLVNKINGKNMLVTLDFETGDKKFRIERGRNPTIFKFFIDGKDLNAPPEDKAQSNSRDSQPDIDKAIGLSAVLFKHIIALNTKTIPFLDEGAAKQREIIEELLGITQLSEKAEILRNNIKDTKTEIEREDFRHSIIVDTNQKTKQTIDQLTIKSNGWKTTHNDTLEKIEAKITKIMEIDIDAEIQKHKDLEDYNKIAQKESDAIRALGDEQRAFNDMKRDYDDAVAASGREHQDAISMVDTLQKGVILIETQEKLIIDSHNKILEHLCPTCGQDVHNDKHIELIKESEKKIEALMVNKNADLLGIESAKKIVVEKETIYNECVEALGTLFFKSKLPPIVHSAPVNISLSSLHYDTIHDAYEHKSNLNNLIAMFEKEALSENPFIDQIETITNNLQVIDYNLMNELVNLLNHQDFLIKLLTRKDSNIRVQIVEQNLSFLNTRLDYYCKQIGLPHQVYFAGDLSVDILKLGHSFDIGNLSSGENTRLVLALSFAFRDMYEILNSPINVMFIDELIDSGMDSKGADNALGILKSNARDHKKNIFLISHRDDFIPRVTNVLMVEMKNNFTDYRYEVDVKI